MSLAPSRTADARGLALARYREKNSEELKTKARERMARLRARRAQDPEQVEKQRLSAQLANARYREKNRKRLAVKQSLKRYDRDRREGRPHRPPPEDKDYEQLREFAIEDAWLAKMPAHIRKRNQARAAESM
ncbi:hypothetical protein B0H15DRAFT_801522 [Mycena belliarum]|uniref:Uncharacterized protein n=1 Tax=Mycena belliarum TaxID=1033014 RepID=A0AAD6U2R9_9AGAR|nr:hypothetical protein B0H15DRAFT_801522 [Mycena belliae]